jgi:adenylate cyclase
LAILFVRGRQAAQVLRWEIPLGQTIRIGRAPRDGLKVPWDMQISREQADIRWQNGLLEVKCLETARNPLISDGIPMRSLVVRPGESFTIAETQFALIDVPELEDSSSQELLSTSELTDAELASSPFRNPAKAMETLAEIPALMLRCTSNEDLSQGVVDLLMRGLPPAEAIAVVALDLNSDSANGAPQVMRWQNRDENERFTPSRRLIQTALASKRGVVHVWADRGGEVEYTMTDSLDWALCVPIDGESSRGWTIYVSGKLRPGSVLTQISGANDLRPELRLVRLVAQYVGAFREVRALRKQRAGVSQFFSAAVMEALVTTTQVESLAPRERDVAILFCDVRGFSKQSEAGAGDLPMLLARVTAALGMMTQSIVKQDGIIADFQGDAALAFWGWPNASPEGPLPACEAALEICTGFRRVAAEADHLLQGFRVGIGVTFGKALAGKIGTEEQSKIGVFGPIVNLGSRLEGLTKQFGVSILIDDATASHLRQNGLDRFSTRRLARIRPAGMGTSVWVHELYSAGEYSPELLNEFAAGVEAMFLGRWEEASYLLKPLADSDRPSAVLLEFMDKTGFQPPEEWDGVITFTGK